MARSRGRAAPARRPAPAATRSHSTQAQHPPPPAPRAAPAPAPAPSGGGGGGMLSGLGGMVAQGMALGTGSALAHRAIDSVFSSSNPPPAQAQEAAQQIVREDGPCTRQARTFADCMSDTSGDMEACRYYFESLQSCKLQLN